jgi:hypothetical protein
MAEGVCLCPFFGSGFIARVNTCSAVRDAEGNMEDRSGFVER